MGLLDVFLIGIGLSMDAFAVSICKGLKMKVIDFRQSFVIALLFGIFQAIMPLIGYGLSVNFAEYISQYSHWVAFVLLITIGGNMIWESVTDKGESDCTISIDLKELFLLAIATSIDALAVGITFGTMGDKMEITIGMSVIMIGVTTFVISLAGVVIGNVFGERYKSKAEIAGGVILILIGVKVVLEHYI